MNVSTLKMAREWTDAKYFEYWKSRCTVSETGCWVSWSAHARSRNRSKTLPGYGQVQYRGKKYRQHRLVYMLFVGPIPDGHMVAHRCDNPPCFNPEHLFVCTGKENMLDAGEKKRWPRQSRDTCINGHPRTPETTARFGARQTLNCLLCIKERRKQYINSGRNAERLRERKARLGRAAK